jgi:hypothetical protein
MKKLIGKIMKMNKVNIIIILKILLWGVNFSQNNKVDLFSYFNFFIINIYIFYRINDN